MNLLSYEIDTQLTSRMCPFSSLSNLPFSIKLHTLIILSLPPEIINSSFDDIAMLNTSSVCPFNSCINNPHSFFQILIAQSLLPETINLLLFVIETHVTSS